jgi:hypothetical protein
MSKLLCWLNILAAIAAFIMGSYILVDSIKHGMFLRGLPLVTMNYFLALINVAIAHQSYEEIRQEKSSS